MAGGRRLDVHGIYSKSVRHFTGQICCGHATCHLSEHNVNETRQTAGAGSVGIVICHLSATTGWV